MKKLKTALLLAATVIGLTACGTMTSEVFEMSPGVYTISGENWVTYDAGDVRMDLMKKAAAYCAKQGKKVNVLQTNASDAVLYGKTATAQVNFTCVEVENAISPQISTRQK